MIPLAARLAAETSCLAGVICIPGFDDRPEKPWQSHQIDGYSFNEWVAALREAVKALKEYSTVSSSSEKKLTGIFHDWGVVAGLMYTNHALRKVAAPDDTGSTVDGLMMNQLVLMDVLLSAHPKTPGMESIVVPAKSIFRRVYDSITTISYRIVLANGYFWQRYISQYLGLLQKNLGFSLLEMVGLSPMRKLDNKFWNVSTLDPFRVIYMAYPYYRLFQTMWTSSKRTQVYGAHLPIDVRKTPVLYLYGKEKNIMFHGEKEVLYLKNEKKLGMKSNAISFEKSGHWPYLSEPDECFKPIKEFMAD